MVRKACKGFSREREGFSYEIIPGTNDLADPGIDSQYSTGTVNPINIRFMPFQMASTGTTKYLCSIQRY